MDWYYEVTTAQDFQAAVEAVREAVAAEGFWVLHIHDVQATFREKGFDRDPYKIIEVCNVRYAKQALERELLVGLMMPCRINVFTQEGRTHIALASPEMLAQFFPAAGLEQLAGEVNIILHRVVDRARQAQPAAA